jgi:hypothetical protein
MSLSAWKRIEVGTPVTITVTNTEPFAGNVLSSTRTLLRVIGATEIRTYRWPARASDAHFESDTRMSWIGDRWRTVTLTIRKEEPCAP